MMLGHKVDIYQNRNIVENILGEGFFRMFKSLLHKNVFWNKF